jgi:hypothetical protein
MAKRQTSVDWMVDQLNSNRTNRIFIHPDLIAEAKKMEMHEIMNAIGVGSYFEPVFPDKYHYRAYDHYISTYEQ